MDHDSSTASAMAIAGAVASGDENAEDLFVLLTINRGEGLTPMNHNGLSDPYCVIRYLNVERRTRTQKNTLAPDFNQHFFFKAPSEDDVEAAVAAESSFTNPQQITVYVMDDDFGFKDNVLGYVEVEVPPMNHAKYVHRDFEETLKAPIPGGTYKELQLIKAG